MKSKYPIRIPIIFLRLLITLMVISCTPKNNLSIQQQKKTAPILKVDALGNAYVATGNTLEKYEYSPFGDKRLRYFENKFGEITSIDVSNPFQILVWYKDFQMIQILDKHLTLLKEIALQNLGFNISSVALSGDKLIWLFDLFEHRLLKINTQKEILFKSSPILDNGKVVEAKSMVEHEGFLYLLDKKIIKFDSFAKQMTTFNVENIDDFHISDSFLILHHKSKYSKMDMNTGAIVELPYTDVIYWSKKYIYVLRNGVLTRKKAI